MPSLHFTFFFSCVRMLMSVTVRPKHHKTFLLSPELSSGSKHVILVCYLEGQPYSIPHFVHEFDFQIFSHMTTPDNRPASQRFVCLFVCLFFPEHNHIPSGKKMMTGVQVITASQVQSIGCRWQAHFVLSTTEH